MIPVTDLYGNIKKISDKTRVINYFVQNNLLKIFIEKRITNHKPFHIRCSADTVNLLLLLLHCCFLRMFVTNTKNNDIKIKNCKIKSTLLLFSSSQLATKPAALVSESQIKLSCLQKQIFSINLRQSMFAQKHLNGCCMKYT